MNTPLGQVTLVGAGPGDPELLTLKAARAIQAASVILVDDLVGEGVLAHARPEGCAWAGLFNQAFTQPRG